ncbi:MAG TPA: VOC family protein [Streptosporangiaceae bacterium]|jgi:catechol 2,3-dioxygenase-like lactoylglutathione lyase family enzyme|nr:VOC family protein [Streptosporangiaceae bacterium]
MSSDPIPSVRPQPMIAVADVPAASRWYQQVLGAVSGHGGGEYEQLLVDGQLIMQLHQRETGHHHGTIGDPELVSSPGAPAGNGVALWFEATGFDAVVGRLRAVGAQIVTDVHTNPNAGHREIWIRDPDGYLVVFAEPYVPAGS